MSKAAEAAMYGPEPIWSEAPSKVDTIRAYSWYNYMCGLDDHTQYFYDFIKERAPDMLKELKKLRNWQIPQPTGWIARMISRQMPLDESTYTWFNRKVFDLYEHAKKINVAKEENVVERISVRSRMMEKVDEYLSEIEDEVDRFTRQGYKSEFSMYDWLKKNQIKGKPAAEIGNFYRPYASELVELNGRSADPQLVEGYSHMSKAERKRLMTFVQTILRDIDTWTSNKKVTRKPRKTKSKSTVSMVKGVKVMRESDEYRVVSIDPTTIVGADVVWVFNTRNRVLSRYVAEGPSGLSVSRSSIRGFDKDNSYGKKIRDPSKVLSRITDGGKVATRKTIDNIKAKKSDVTGRLNEKMILLKAEK